MIRSSPLAVAAVLVAACTGPSVTAPAVPAHVCPGALAGELLLTRPGQRACTADCLDAQSAACASDGRVWRLELNERLRALLGLIHVAPSGMARVEQTARDLYGVGGHVWTSCLAMCGDVPKVCSPFASKVALSGVSGVDDCATSTAASTPWRGHPSSLVTLTCKGITLQLRVVPALRAVRDALLTSGLLGLDDQGATLDGLTVSVILDGQEHPFFTDVVEESCDVLAVPADHQVHASLADFEQVAQLHEDAWSAVQPQLPESPDASLGDRIVGDATARLEQLVCAHYATPQGR